MYQNEIQKTDLHLVNAQLTQQLYHSKNSQLEQQFKEAKARDKMLEQQRQLQAKQWNTLESISQQVSEVEKGESQYQARIKDVLARVSLDEDHKLKLEDKLMATKTHIKVLKQKNQSVSCILFSLKQGLTPSSKTTLSL